MHPTLESDRGELTHVVPVAVVPATRHDGPLGNERDRYREAGGCLGAARLLALAASGYSVVEKTERFCWTLNRQFSVVIEDREGNLYLAIFRRQREIAARQSAVGLRGRAPAY